MNKRIRKMLERINRINFRKISMDIFRVFLNSYAFSVIYCFLYSSNDINKKIITVDMIIAEANKLFYMVLTLKLIFELFMAVFNDSYDGWLKNRNIVYERSGTSQESSLLIATSNKEIADFNDKIIGVHEAGHALMAFIMGIEKFTVKTSYINSCVSMDVGKLLYANDLKKHIYIDYSGAIAEELFFSSISTGCMGTDKSDFEIALKRIKQFIILSEPKFSKTGLDKGIDERVVELSKVFYEEAKNILKANIKKIEKLAESLYGHKTLTKEDIEKILIDTN